MKKEKSDRVVERWENLISETNWQKGQLIAEWREAMAKEGRQFAADEDLAKTVGGITGLHVTRLRQTHNRFACIRRHYPNLRWSHFQAAVCWDDAERWLLLANEQELSVSQMRAKRWEAVR